MSDQRQHRIPEVYLKQFGFQDSNGKWWVSTWKLGDKFTANKSIKSFTKELNTFDLPVQDIKLKRLFENYTSQLETNYPWIINEIKSNKKFSEKGFGIVIQLMISVLARTKRFMEMICQFLSSEKREYFLSEVTYYFEESEKQSIVKSLKRYDNSNQVNLILFSVCVYFVRKLTSSGFDFVILKSPPSRGWFTTDNPVVLLNSINRETLLSKETEIYFPLSKDYCLYIDHSDYNRSNSLRGVNEEEVTETNEEKHDRITKYVVTNSSQYLIHPFDMERTRMSFIK